MNSFASVVVIFNFFLNLIDFFLGIDFCAANECYNPEVKWSIQMFYDYLQWKQMNHGDKRKIYLYFNSFLGSTVESFVTSKK